MDRVLPEVLVFQSAGEISEFVSERIGKRSGRGSSHKVSLQSGEESMRGKSRARATHRSGRLLPECRGIA
jgi:hypothetical protein